VKPLAKEPFSFGVLLSQSGVMDVSETAHLRGILVACEEINARGGIDGHPLSPIIVDPKGDDRMFAELAAELLLREKVNVIFGCCLSSSRKVVLPVVERFNGVLFYPSVYEGFEYSPNVIYGGAVPNQLVVPLLEYLYNRHGRRIALVGSDTLYAREINRIVKEFLFESSGTCVNEQYLSLSSTAEDFAVAARKVADLKPDAILSTVVGQHSIALYEAYATACPQAKRAPIASLTTTEAELALMSPGARVGHLAVSPYFSSIDTPENGEFTELYHRFHKTGSPGVYAQVAYALVHFYANALRTAGRGDTDSLLAALSGAVFNAPGGDLCIDAETNHVSVRPLIGKADADGQYAVVWRSPMVIRADPYLIAYDRSVGAMS
jgi:ABC-type branched-subunit amino acid transport system substrate-binding protein